MFSGIGFCILILLVCVYLDSLRSGSQRSRVSRADDRELERHIRRLDRQERLSTLYKAYQTPWPWWFLGSCLAFAGLCVGAGITSWPHVDSYALMLIGTLFLCTFTFKAWAQTLARQEPLPEPPVRQSQPERHASSSRCLPVLPRVRPIGPLSTASRLPSLPRPLPLPKSSCHQSTSPLTLPRNQPRQDAQAI